jgi:hypothetical protein
VSKVKPQTIRSHSQERQWLLNLGQGDLVKGVRSLVEQSREGAPAKNGALKTKKVKK